MVLPLKRRLEKTLKKTWLGLNSRERAIVAKQMLHPRQPICDFEKACGLTGLSRRYLMPSGHSSRKTEIEFSLMRQENYVVYDQDKRIFAFVDAATAENQKTYLSQARKLISELCRLNPELQAVPLETDNVDHSVDFILGVTSGYLPEDICYYMSKTQNSNHWLKTPHIAFLNNRLRQHFPETTLGGVLSPETCTRIHAQLDRKFKPD